MNREILRMERISMWAGGKPVLRSARFNLLEGEIAGVVGMNYSGKTALMGVAAGFSLDYEGDFYLMGKPVRIASTEQAKRLGIYHIQQKSMLIDRLTIEENMLIAPGQGGTIIRRAESRKGIEDLFQSLGMTFDCDESMGDLGFYRRFQVEVARGVLGGARVIILDGVLNEFSAQMLESLHGLFDKLLKRRIGLILVDNGIRYLKPFCDRIFVMRKGMTAGILTNRNLDDETVVSMMLGYKVRANKTEKTRQPADPGHSRVLLEWKGVSYKNVLRDMSFTVREGETVGLLNVNKCSGDAIHEILTDATQPARGRILFDGKPFTYLNTERTLRRGLAVLPDDGEIFSNFSLEENIAVAAMRHHGRFGLFFNQRKLHYEVSELIDDFLCAGPVQLARGAVPDDRPLRRKIVLCRMLVARPKLLVMMHPTRGMDELMTAEVAEDARKIRARGVALMIVSTDVEFLLSVCSRILIINSGTVERDFPVTAATRADLLNQYGRYVKDL